MELWTMEKLSKNIFEFDEEWKEDRRGHCGSLDNRKLSKNIFEFDERWEEDRRENYETLDDGKSKKKLCKNIFESKLIKVSYLHEQELFSNKNISSPFYFV